MYMYLDQPAHDLEVWMFKKDVSSFNITLVQTFKMFSFRFRIPGFSVAHENKCKLSDVMIELKNRVTGETNGSYECYMSNNHDQKEGESIESS